jgi:SAM-dependent methyltransferase
MSAREKEMAELLAKNHREERFSAIINCIDHDVSAILDLGCGIGALASRLAKRFPSTMIVGVDRSKYLLSKLRREGNVMTILGDIPALPLKNRSFDLVVAVQVLHEIFHFKGVKALVNTFHSVAHLLRNDGELIILDHSNPGDTQISFRLSEELQKKLREFQSKFKPRKITYCDLGNGRIRTSMRDFYDFVTKIWALNSGLEEEEMSETHTPFTAQELENLIQETGFEVTHTISLTSMERHLEYYDITLEKAVKLPNRHILVKAKKIQKIK